MDRLHQLADELRDLFSERGYAVDRALNADRAFRNNKRPQSALVRALVQDGVMSRSAAIGLNVIPVVGGGLDVQAIIDGKDVRCRVLKGNVDPETGQYVFMASSDAIMTVTEAETDSLIPTERWVFGYTVDADGMLVDILAARVLVLSEDAVPRLVLGHVTQLGVGFTPPKGSFRPADEDDLPGMEDGDQEEGFAEGV